MLRSKNKIVMGLLVLLVALPTILSAISEEALVWMLIVPGSRPGGMGEAFVAQADDGYATYWNPGSMAFNTKTQIAGMHTNWLQGSGVNDIYYEFLSWNQYVPDVGNIGFFVQFMNLGSQDHTDEANTDLGSFDSYAFAAAFSYGYKVNENWGVGSNFKFIRSDLGPAQGNTDSKGEGMTFAFDFAVKCKDILQYLELDNDYIGTLAWGANLQNVGHDITYVDDAQEDPLPMNFRTGISYNAWHDELSDIRINFDVNKVLANEDGVLTRLISDWNEKNYIYNSGVEYTYLGLLSLRGGYVNDKEGEIVGSSFGVGIHYTFQDKYDLSADFAMQQGGDLVDYNKTFSLSLDF